MEREAALMWSSLEFRKPALLRLVEPLSEEQMRWTPGVGLNSIAWQLWHIAEVEDNWVRDKLLDQPRRYPFGIGVRAAAPEAYPAKDHLLRYFHEVRALTRERLEALLPDDFERQVEDESFGRISVRELWGGVITSFAWHAGQIALTAKLWQDRRGLGKRQGQEG